MDYNKNDLEKAIEQNAPLLVNGDSISKEAYEFLLDQKKNIKNMIFKNFVPKERPSFYMNFECSACGMQHDVKFIKSYITSGLKITNEVLHKIDYGYYTEIVEYAKLYLNINLAKTLICTECIESIIKLMELEYEPFYQDPLKWVNEHDPENFEWLWRFVYKLYNYPSTFKNIPNGYKYCGVTIGKIHKDRFNSYRRDKFCETFFDENYIQWKNLKENTITLSKYPTVHEVFSKLNLLNDIEDDIYNSRKKSINMAEKLLNGLIEREELSILLASTIIEAKEISKKLKQVKGINRVMDFGKYRGLPIHSVIENNPNYIQWALENKDRFILTENEMKHFCGEEWEEEKEEEI